ncbi:MAG: hypothetical protein IKG11_04470 [Atopobiaceae bacterium]|nr:hypothetical protein [Atopobiaceae bacterium]MDO4405046.1 hypothetical protein [Atopobiaceae bacterium]
MASEDNVTPRRGRHAAVNKPVADLDDERLVPLKDDDDNDLYIPPTSDNVYMPLAYDEEGNQYTPLAYNVDDAMQTGAVNPIPYGAIPDLVPIIDGDQETNMGDAPRPIGVDPEATGSFQRIDADSGARLTTRANASETASFRVQNVRPEAVRMSSSGRPKVEHHEVAVRSNKRVFIILGVAALVVVGIVATLLVRALLSVEKPSDTPVVEQTQATADGSIEYRGSTYFLTQQESGKYALASTSEGSEGTSIIYELTGTPVALILYNTVFVIPENLPDGTWDLIAHPLGGGSVTQQVTDGEGSPIIGQGEITNATLDGESIQISTSAGEELSISLV